MKIQCAWCSRDLGEKETAGRRQSDSRHLPGVQDGDGGYGPNFNRVDRACANPWSVQDRHGVGVSIQRR